LSERSTFTGRGLKSVFIRRCLTRIYFDIDRRGERVMRVLRWLSRDRAFSLSPVRASLKRRLAYLSELSALEIEGNTCCAGSRKLSLCIMLIQSGIQEEHTHCTMCEIIVCGFCIVKSARELIYMVDAGERALSAWFLVICLTLLWQQSGNDAHRYQYRNAP
jgi:hypothetical protein